ncbi:MAG: ATPase [Agathobacter sp.]|nr:ATPase [Agathobacter sp.]
MLKESLRLNEQIKRLKQEIAKLPEGKLVHVQNGQYNQWHQSDGHKKTYIPKKKHELAEKLAIKKYLSYQLEDCENEKRAIEFYLRHHREGVGMAEKFLTEKSEYEELLAPYFKTKSKELQEWLQEPFESNPQYNDNLILKTISGNPVRSKSEVIIDTLLYINKIPFRYECALKLGRRTYYPDFTIKHPRTGKIYYWEHFGMMDEEEYVKKACSKLQVYALNGIVPSINLIMTFETSENPLGAEDVMELIEKYFDIETEEGTIKLQFGA